MIFNKYKKLVPANFKAEEYFQLNPDVREAGADPYRHYVEHGAKEGRIYNIKENLPPNFDYNTYFLLNPDVKASGIDAGLHYVRFGVSQNRPYQIDNDATFDPMWYIEEYPDVSTTGMSPFDHYQKVGIFEGRHKKFDPVWYLSEYPDIANSELDPLVHYRSYGRDECRHPAFHEFWYNLEYYDVKESGLNPEDHYNLVGRDEGRLPAFNARWYVDEYPEIAEAGVNPYQHYLTNGRGEGRKPAFATKWYVQEYPDVAASGLGSYAHYRKYAKQVGYSSGPTRSQIIEHSVRLKDFPDPYDARYEPQKDFDNLSTTIKAITFYLPQFHVSEHNNKWWGEGFTEWTNTKKSKARFEGHFQPREPHLDIGYYDLSNPEVIKRQAEQARKHGIYGFCFYHYWFSGERLLEKPVDILLANKDIDIKFCLCWANENWTKTWDGQESNVLIKQQYSMEDPSKFIKDISVYLLDERYIRVAGKPVIMVYKPHLIPEVGRVFATWRQFWKIKTGEDLLIWCNRTEPSDYSFEQIDAEIDAVVEFPPHVVPHSRHVPKYRMIQKFAGIKSEGNFYDYRRLVDDIVSGKDYAPIPVNIPFYRGVTLGWDNSARRATGQSIWFGFSLAYYYKWLRYVVDYTVSTFDDDKRFVFINAWNEWAEGTYLEPDVATGYANLNTTSKAIFGEQLKSLPTFSSAKISTNLNLKIAVHLHVYFLDQVDFFVEQLNQIDANFDLFITTDSDAKNAFITEIFSTRGIQKQLKVLTTPNVGRDIGPMLMFVSKYLLEYDVIGHFHTKKSSTVKWGDRWCKYLVSNLLGSTNNIKGIFAEFTTNESLGLVYPPTYPLISPHVSWGEVKDRCYEILKTLRLNVLLPSDPEFPAGNMFWARVPAIIPILRHNWEIDDFETEAGQIEKTLPHCIERLWGYVASASGYESKEILNGFSLDKSDCCPQPRRLTLFVHYNANDVHITDADLYLLMQLKRISAYICVASNSDLSAESKSKVLLYADDVFIRPNAGLDFGAWRDCLNQIGWTKVSSYDEIIFVNNSCYGPIFPFETMFDQMSVPSIDFWGVTSFPEVKNSGRPEAVFLKDRNIPAHIQSYFMVVKKNVVNSPEFYRFWSNVEDKHDFMDVVTSYEMGFTAKMTAAGFHWGAYIKEASEMQLDMINDHRFNTPYNKPFDLIILGSPLLKKRSWDYNSQSLLACRELLISSSNFPAHYIWR
ncbi:glycoside hydrolase family 99-like domain-containing protein [Methylobacterium sp. Leaf117]|uniref:glycoside hydrolase family 99-like domain-containing protein n=1 Tax=Methylobacterium sp. Leaf117 TaxID=1736260 RepID=UPI000A5BDA4B|nr:glycoside hydrolase family 99-like domain-containing protein [Methylobacterium sp. Leaf117]